MSSEKRAASDSFGSQSLVKRQRSAIDIGKENGGALSRSGQTNGTLLHGGNRTSGLKAPVMELNGHSGEVFATKFDPSGQHIASGSMDRSILLWRTFGECENYGILNGHKGAVLDLCWSRDSQAIFSASSDSMIGSWDLETGQKIRWLVGHEATINCLDISKRGEEILYSACDDGYIGIWDPRQKLAVAYMEDEFPATAVAAAEAGNELFSGGIDNVIKVWDLRKKAVAYTMLGHTDTITSLALSPDSQWLASKGMDSTVRMWDIRPFAPAERQTRAFDGAAIGLERNLVRASWDSGGRRIACGSGDGSVVIWEAASGKLVYKLPGHRGSVNDVQFHPGPEAIVLSGSSDRSILLGELGR
ncbi:MAG: hypothetical protein M1829_002764 [Trizodia sp. TS-e1964]|nr:MAG: hypothetical protein M1829_002764 [Trizodia sp. TS-e1964]